MGYDKKSCLPEGNFVVILSIMDSCRRPEYEESLTWRIFRSQRQPPYNKSPGAFLNLCCPSLLHCRACYEAE
jgi:hypothetical protein